MADGTAGNDNLNGTSGNDTLNGLAGDDSILGDAGSDLLTGGDGNDTLRGEAGQDTLQGDAGNDSLDGGTITDTVNYTDLNWVRYDSATTGVVVNLQTGSASDGLGGTDTLANINFVGGTQYNDSLTGSTGPLFEHFDGGAGDDTIDGGAISGSNSNRVSYAGATSAVNVSLAAGTATGGGGNDLLANINFVRGSSHNDSIVGSDATAYTETFDGRAGNDTIDGRGGTDWVRFEAATAGVVVNLTPGKGGGASAQDGQGGTDTLYNIENVRGADFNDSITGNDGGNQLEGRGGNDSLYGGKGQDTLTGGAGDDLLDGGQTDSPVFTDWAIFSGATGALAINLATGVATGEGNDTLVGIESVVAGNFDDQITGNDQLNLLRGGLGNDTLDGGAGNDYADYWQSSGPVTVSLATNSSSGAAGVDTLSNFERIRGSDFNDSLTGDANDNYLRGMGGNDTLDGGAGNDWADYYQASTGVSVNLGTGAMTGPDGADVFVSIENILGSLNNNDTLTGDAGANVLSGVGGNDSLVGGAGNDTLFGDSGSDSMTGGAGNDIIDGGTITDTVAYSDLNLVHYNGATSGVNVNLGAGTASDGEGGTDTLQNVNFVRGSAHADTLTGGTGWFEQFDGGAGNDIIDGGTITGSTFNRASYQNATGAVTVNLGTGTASDGEGGTDTLLNINSVRGSKFGDVLTGSDRIDFQEQFEGREGDDTIDGKGGVDLVRYDNNSTPVVVDLVAGTASGGTVHGNDTLTNIENVRGSQGGDVITGNAFANHLDGRNGADTLNGGGGNDTVVGGWDADYLQGGDGDDNLDGQNHSDVMYGEAGNDYIQAFGGFEAENDYIDGGDGHDIASYNFGWVSGPVNFTSSGSGTTSRAQTDINGGSDTLVNIEEVHIFGGGSGDVLTGDAGRNYMSGNGGNDTLTGGDGYDTFSYWVAQGAIHGTDLITDLGRGDDLSFSNIQLSGPVLAGADGGALTKGQMMVGGFDGSTTKVFVGTDDTAGADIVIDLQGNHKASDFFVNNDFWGTWVRYDPALNLVGGSGNDNLQGGENNDTIDGADGNDNLNGNGGNDLLYGGKGDDFIGGGPGTDTMYGGGGNDYLFAGGGWDAGSDVIDGGDGTDIVNYGYHDATAAVSFTATVASGQQIDPYGGTDQLTSIEELHFFGGDFGDTFVGDGLRSYIQGRGGNDTLTGGGGSDTFSYDLVNVPDSGVDRVKDFGLGDSLDFQSVTLNNTIQSGSDPTGLAEGQVRVSPTVSNVTTVWVGTSKATGGYVTIELEGTYTSANFGVYNGSFGGGLSYVQPGWMVGHFGNDTLNGGSGNDTILGLEGDDQLNGNDGNDSIDGGPGNDYITSGSGSDTVEGGAGFDIASMNFGDKTAPVTFTVAEGSTQSDPFGGTDVLSNIEEIHVFGGEGGDSLTGNSQRNFIGGNGGNDTLTGGGGSDTFFFYAGRNDNGLDTVTDLQAGEDIAFGQVAGFSVSTIASGDDASGLTKGQVTFHTPADGKTKVSVGLDDIAGSDLSFYLTGSFAAKNFQAYNQPWGSGMTYTPGQLIVGDNNSNNLNGGSGDDTIQGQGGDDYIHGGAGDDSIDGGTGNDWVFHDGATGGIVLNLATGSVTGGGGNDTLAGIEHVGGSGFGDAITGDGNNNSIQGRGGDDTLDGGAGTGDNADYYHASGSVTVNLATGQATGADGTDTLSNIENITGSFHDDSLTGNGSNNFIAGLGGNDTIDGGAGFDAVGYWDATAGVEVNLATGQATGASGTDTLTSIEHANGSNHADKLTGDAGNNNLRGEGGNDTLFGGAGSDSFNGGAGNDAIDGGEITDRINYTDLNSIEYNNATSGIDLNLQTGIVSDGLGGTDTLANINFVTGSGFADKLTGSTTPALFEAFTGGLGDDTIDGGAIDPNTLSNANRANYGNASGGVTVDLTLGKASGAAGNDTLANINHVNGSGFADTLLGSGAVSEEFQGAGGKDSINGFGGTDVVRYDYATAAVTANLATGVATVGDGSTDADTLVNIEGLRGSNFADSLTGGNAANDAFEIFFGNGGNDTLDGGSGFDRADYSNSTSAAVVTLGGAVDGSAQDGLGGTDVLRNIEGVRGSANNDTLTGSDAAGLESFEGRGGNDVIDGKGGRDRVDYKFGPAAVNVNLGAGTAADGWGGTDALANIEDIRATAFADTLVGNGAANVIEGWWGNDMLTGGAGNDTFVFDASGNGQDTISDFAAGDVISVNATLTAGTGTAGDGSTVSGKGVQVSSTAGTTLVSIDTDGVAGADLQIKLTGTFAASAFTVVDNGNGTSRITFSAGIVGTAGPDSLIGTEAADSISGLAGNDTLAGGPGSDTLDGGADFDTVTYAAATSGVTVELWANRASKDGQGGVDTLLNVEALVGSELADLLAGNEGANQLGGSGGNDSLYGGAGNDTLIGGAGSDYMDGGAGFDTVSYASATAGVTAELWQSKASGDGQGGADTLVGVEALAGSAFADVLAGDANANTLDGGSGNDSLYGGGGNDTLSGGAGNDQLNGGAGVDRFVLELVGTDTIQDFAAGAGGDTLDLAPIVAGLSGFAGGDPFASGHVRLVQSGANTRVEVDRDAAGGGFGFDNLVAVLANVTATALTSVNFAGGYTPVVFTPNQNLTGTAGADNLAGAAGNDTLSGLAGNDTLAGGAGNDTLDGGADFDTVTYAGATSGVTAELWANKASKDGQGGVDTLLNIEALVGSGFADLLAGSAAANSLDGGAGNDSLYGGGGNDTLVGSVGNDYLDAGAGTDTVTYASATSGVTAELWGNRASKDGLGGADTLLGFESVIGSAHADLLAGDTLANTLDGGAGNDSLYGGGGNDTLVGGAGNDYLDAGAGTDTVTYATATSGVTAELWGNRASKDGLGGADTLLGFEGIIGSAQADLLAGDTNANTLDGGAGNDSLYGGAGNDTLIGGAGNDYLDAGAGTDTVTYAGATSGVTAELWGNRASKDGLGGADTLLGFEGVIGSGFADLLAGDTLANTLDGGAGNDSLYGGGGNDTLIGGAGNDYLDAGVGTDTVTYASATSGVTVELWQSRASKDGLGGADTLLGFEGVIGSSFADLLAGDTNANTLDGGAGNDSLYGGGGNDSLTGGGGNDYLDAGAGTDTLAFASGSGVDTVANFSVAQSDVIQLASNINGSGITSAAAALAATSDVSGNAVVNLGSGHTITLVGITTASLTEANFVVS